MTRLWRLFWHGYRFRADGFCERCRDYEISDRHPRGMTGRRIGRWYL